MMRWYVVQTQARREGQALYHLRAQGFEVYLPQYMKRRSHARRIDWRPFPLFPRYLFVRFDPDRQQWRSIQSTIGVSKLISFWETPIPVPDRVIEGITAREDNEGLVNLGLNCKLRRGDKVQVIDGALSELDGVFDCMDDKKRAFIFLEMLGQKVKVRLPLDAIHTFA